MLCVMARRYLAAGDDPGAGALARHLASCPGCRSERDRLRELLTMLSVAAPPLRVDETQFTDRLMSTIRARERAAVPQPASFGWALLRPITVLPALCLMLAAGFTALYLSGDVSPVPSERMAANASLQDAPVDEYQDTLRPPREIPFTVDQDLVGTRRGSIPLTTYVLEPAPREEPIRLASF